MLTSRFFIIINACCYFVYYILSGKETSETVGSGIISILRDFVPFPAEFVALTLKLNVPVVVGVPVIAPVVVFKTKPVGNLPLETDQVIGVVPVAVNVWL